MSWVLAGCEDSGSPTYNAPNLPALGVGHSSLLSRGPPSPLITPDTHSSASVLTRGCQTSENSPFGGNRVGSNPCSIYYLRCFPVFCARPQFHHL